MVGCVVSAAGELASMLRILLRVSELRLAGAEHSMMEDRSSNVLRAHGLHENEVCRQNHMTVAISYSNALGL